MKKLCLLPNRNVLGKPLKCYILLASILVALVILYFSYLKPGKVRTSRKYLSRETGNYLFESVQNEDYKEERFTGARIVHLDLKGAPPKISYYKKLFPLIARMGATGILMEYEDMFPYKGLLLKNTSALNAYTIEDINYINKLAADNKLDIIPLLQTFGHLEFMLKLEEFKEYREIPEFPQVICPTHSNTLELIVDMVTQVIQAHPNSKMIHIGADEVYYLGICDRCSSAMSKFNLSKNMLFLDHIDSIISQIHKRYPNLGILMWDDQFRGFTMKEFKSGYLNKAIQPVVWKYSKDVYEELGPSLWDMYEQVFPKLWMASAFKGAIGSNQYVSDVTHYVQNHRSWMDLFSEYKNRINFQGIIITGWQRYDHFAILCELIPVSLPSLAMSLRVIMGFKDSPLSPPTEVAKILGCEQPYALIGPVFGSPRCSFPGGDILENVLRLQQLKQEYESILEDSRVKGWLSEYNVKNKFSNPQHVLSVTAPLGRIKSELIQIDIDLSAAMYEVYDNFTVNEFRETYLKPFEDKVSAMWDAKEQILAKDAWPRRPLLPNEDANNEL